MIDIKDKTYLLSAIRDGKRKDVQCDDGEALNLLIRGIVGTQSMEETSASLLAMKLMNDARKGRAQGIANSNARLEIRYIGE